MDDTSSPPQPSLRPDPAGGSRSVRISALGLRSLAHLRLYFASGWAFLIPYLLAYLLYYWQKWPVNTSTPRVPSLLHVYWTVHAVNLFLGAVALWTWWAGSRCARSQSPLPPVVNFLPWVFLGLLFIVPGLYLEFPADTWEHLRRINEWSNLSIVREHSAAIKAAYFLAYSLIREVPAEQEVFWLNLYCAGASLILCWQYFRLAQTIGLKSRPAFIFVVVQTMLFGNNVFSFYRYYGISSTIFSQIGAIALIRIALETASGTAGKQGASGFRFPIFFRKSGWDSFLAFRIFAVAISLICLLLLIVFNHLQGLGIAALGLTAIIVWRLLEWKRSLAWILGVAAVILSVAAIHWMPRDPAIDGFYRSAGVLNTWYGFDIFSFGSMAANRTMQILGVFGLVNLAAGVFLLRRNHIVGWLTVIPIVALELPFVAIPFATVLTHVGDVITFQRMLFAIPAGLALVSFGQELVHHDVGRARFHIFRCFHSGIAPLGLLALVATPIAGPFYNRSWNIFAIPPADLTMGVVRDEFFAYIKSTKVQPLDIFAATTGLSFTLNSQKPVRLICLGRTYNNNGSLPSSDLDLIRRTLEKAGPSDHFVLVGPSPTLPFTFVSFAALGSHHWLPQEDALGFSGAQELRALSIRHDLHLFKAGGQVNFYLEKGR